MPNEIDPDIPDVPDVGPIHHTGSVVVTPPTTTSGGGLSFVRVPLKSTCAGENSGYVGDTLVAYSDFITDADGHPIDGMGKTVAFSIYPAPLTPLAPGVQATPGAVITSKAAAGWLASQAGLAVYNWQPLDVATAGGILLYWHITDPATNRTLTIPGNGGQPYVLNALGT